MLKVVRRGPVLVENEKIKNLFAGGQLGDKKWTSEMASADEDMGARYFLVQLFYTNIFLCLYNTKSYK